MKRSTFKATSGRARFAAGGGVEALESRRLLAGTAIPTGSVVAMLTDPARNRLYIVEASGRIDRWDIATQSMLSPINLSSPALAADITPDGGRLYVTDATAS